MPYRWLPSSSPDAPRRLEIWPHQSLGPAGFAVMIGATALLLTVPLLALLATPGFWVMLPFLAIAILALWLALTRSRRDRKLTEVLTLSPNGEVSLVQSGPAGEKAWRDNGYWVKVQIYPTGGPVEHYLTLKGPAGREVEIGAFLAPEEREELQRLLSRELPMRH